MASVGKTSVEVRGLSKSYTLSHNVKRATTMGAAVASRLRKPMQRVDKEVFWALRDVSFDVHRGEAVGIIGRNGAGKSTLLKLLSRITTPTAGEIVLYGPVGSLLEVGTGFHPELTGRENIYLNGSILGMRRKEISKYFDAIVDFAEVEQFLDTPVKRYSSGMYVRLAFAVAAHLNPEILIVDEVLAVGDANFQKKCLGKMGEVASQEGRTVLFVSHNMTAVQSLCGSVLWMDQGGLREQGKPKDVVTRYLKTSYSSQREQLWDDIATAPGGDKAKLRRASIRPDHGSEDPTIDTHTPLVLEFEFWNLKPGTRLNVSATILNDQGLPIFNTVPTDEPMWHGKPFPVGLFRSMVRIPGDLLNDGNHRVMLYIVEDQSVVLSKHEDLLGFEVIEPSGERQAYFGKWEGIIRPRLQWTTELVDSGAPNASSDRTSRPVFGDFRQPALSATKH
jgi:lipopolysaccharide transport system ATP-binding protein